MKDLFNSCGPNTLFGIRVVISKDCPRYVLPEEVMPGIPWPPGFRDKINAWSLDYLGTINMLPPGQIFRIGNDTIVVRQEEYQKLRRML
jgi:hypothetical protein